MRTTVSALAALVSASLLCSSSAQFFNDFDQPPHDYWTAPMNDPMTRLLGEIKAGKVHLPDEAGLPMVRRLLDELDIPVESQVLVFSRTSLQRGAVSPSNPRAIYFNDETYLGWMPGGRIEIASADPERGAVFYFQRKLAEKDGPLFVRDQVCIQCHAGSATNFLPGLLARSVYPDARGRSLRSVDSFERVGHGVPIKDRWGGWYVTGGHDGLRHMGNSLGSRGDDGVEIDRASKAGLSELSEFFDPGNYPRPDSDIVALLVLDHQVSMDFELLEAHYVVRQLMADAGWSEGKVPDKLPDEFAEEISATAERLVEYLLFQKEASLGGKPIVGEGSFKKSFASRARQDSKGRSLRDFDLNERLFKFRCSYMIYSPAFGALPPVLRDAVFSRLREILGADMPPSGYGHLQAPERRAILEILRETVPAFTE